jgi:hypothetical protein
MRILSEFFFQKYLMTIVFKENGQWVKVDTLFDMDRDITLQKLFYKQKKP